jgi:hypothetical protein
MMAVYDYEFRSDRDNLMLSRARRLNQIYTASLLSILPNKDEEHYDWFFNRKVPLYEERLIRHAFLTKEARNWMEKVRRFEVSQEVLLDLKML